MKIKLDSGAKYGILLKYNNINIAGNTHRMFEINFFMQHLYFVYGNERILSQSSTCDLETYQLYWMQWLASQPL